MRQLSIACSLLLVASVVSAGEAKKAETKPAAAPPAVTSTVPDSPLVAAAKKSKRKNAKPANVITNETLAKSGGHVTEAQKLPDLLPVPPPPKPAAVDPLAADRARRAELQKKQEEEKKIAEQKKADAQRARATAQDDSLDEQFEDPAAAEHAMQQDPANQQKPPQ